jgi:hypothetical protein
MSNMDDRPDLEAMGREQALRKATLDAQEEARKSNALAGRCLARAQEQQHELFQLREAISQALACLRREDIAGAVMLLRDTQDR